MALAIRHSRGAHTRAVAGEPAAPRVYERPVGAAFTGLAALLVGAWGALAGYIGPYFAFRPVDQHVWVASWQNGLLHLLPGAVAAAAGLMLLAMGPARRSVRGGAFLLPAVLLLGAGAWFVIGPVAWPTFHSGAAFNPVMSATRNLLNVACASFAPGLFLVMLGGMALKAAMVPVVPVEDPYTPTEAGRVPADRAAADRTAADRAAADRAVADRTVADAPPVVERGSTGRGWGWRRRREERQMAGNQMAGNQMAGDRTVANAERTDQVREGDVGRVAGAEAGQPVVERRDV